MMTAEPDVTWKMEKMLQISSKRFQFESELKISPVLERSGPTM